MAAFRIFDDQENFSNLHHAGKENPNLQKRSVLGLVNSNANDRPRFAGNRTAKNNIEQNVGVAIADKVLKNQIIGKQISEKLYSNTDVLQPQPLKSFKIFQDVAEKQKVKSSQYNVKRERVLRDKLIERTVETSSHEDEEIPALITTLQRAAAVPASTVVHVSPERMNTSSSDSSSPMSIDKSITQINSPKVQNKRDSEPTALERLMSCEEYRDDIHLYLRGLESRRRPRKNYMLKQTDITYQMRSILVDWLVEVVEEYNMHTDTLYLAVSYIDRFLSFMSVVRAKLQLVGTAAMFIASKFEEIYPPDVKDFVYITDDTYTKKQVLRMEHLILRVLNFDLSTPTSLVFLVSFISQYPVSDKVKYLAMYLSELTLLEANPFLEYLPSEIAASALIVARYTIQPNDDIFPDTLQEVLDYHIEELIPCIEAVEKTFQNAENNPQQAIKEKYKSDKYCNISSMTPLNENSSTLILIKLRQENTESDVKPRK